ncbi:MAG: hypothetical protein WC712_06625 [Candidatus Brocadiia bacterium]
MYTRVALAALSVALLLCPACADEAKTYNIDNVAVTYQDLEEEFIVAYAKALQIARKSAIEDWGFDMPDTVRLVVKSGSEQITLETDGKDGVYFNITKTADGHNFPESGALNMYGICHEIGHMCMYRLIKDTDWFANEACEAWARYYGCRTLQKVFDKEGAKLAPGNYDYSKEGLPRLEKALRDIPQDENDIMTQLWDAFVKKAGETEIPKIFAEWGKTVPQAPDALAAAEAALKVAKRAQPLTEWWKSIGNNLILKTRSAYKPQNATGLAGKAKELVLDDGTPLQKVGIAAGGFVTKFKSPFKKTAITQVKLYGSRYGDKKMNLRICLLDEMGMIFASFFYDYSVFSTEPDWVTLKIKPTTVPETFYVCLLSRADAKDGIYVWYDAAQSGTSFYGTMGVIPYKPSNGDWLIRPTVDTCK